MLAGGLLTAACALLSACTTAREVVLPITLIGQRAYSIDCSGANISWSHCYQKAGKVCPQGYLILQKPYQHGEHVVPGDVFQLAGASSDHRRMLIECRVPGAVTPPVHIDGAPHASG